MENQHNATNNKAAVIIGIIAAFGILVGFGLPAYLYLSRHSATPVLQIPSKALTGNEVPVGADTSLQYNIATASIDGWKKYSHKYYHYQFYYPDDWELDDTQGGADMKRIVVYGPSAFQAPEGENPVEAFAIEYVAPATDSEWLSRFENTKTVYVNGFKATQGSIVLQVDRHWATYLHLKNGDAFLITGIYDGETRQVFRDLLASFQPTE